MSSVHSYIKIFLFAFVCRLLPKYFLVKLLLFITTIENNGKDKTLLVLNRPFFDLDIEQLRKNKKFNFLTINLIFIGYIQKFYLPKKFQVQTNYQKVQQSDLRHYKFLQGIFEEYLNILGKKFNIVCAVSPHIDYWQPEILRSVCQNKNISFVAICRENPVFDFQKNKVFKYYNKKQFKFQGDLVFVFHQKVKNIFQKAKVFNSSKIIVSGAPRLEAYKKIKKKKLKFIALFDFSIGYFADNAFIMILKYFSKNKNIINKNNLTILIKCKKKENVFFVQNLIRKYDLHSDIFKITYKEKMKNILEQTKFAINYNSLSIADCILSHTPLILLNCKNHSQKNNSKILFKKNYIRKFKRHKKIIKFVKYDKDFEKNFEKISNRLLNLRNTQINFKNTNRDILKEIFSFDE